METVYQPGSSSQGKKELWNSIRAHFKTHRQGPPLKKVVKEGNVPLSLAQHQLWLLDQWHPRTSVFNIYSVFLLEGDLKVTVLEMSLVEIVRRHDILRTTFGTVDGQPVQVILPHPHLRLPVVDLERFPGNRRVKKSEALASEEIGRPFNLAEAPLLRCKLIRLAENEHLFTVTMHHIISDDYSMTLFLKELSIIYEAFSCGSASPLLQLPVQYSDFVYWQQQWLQSGILAAQENYWKQQLCGIVPLELPTKSSHSLSLAYKGSVQSLEIPQNVTDALETMTHKEGVSLFMVLLAAFKALLHRVTSREDILVASPVECRSQVKTKNLIGYFNNILLLRTDLSGNPTSGELMVRVRQTVLSAYENQDFPFHQLMEFEGLTGLPLTRPMFGLYNIAHQLPKFPGVVVSKLGIHNGWSNFDLFFYILKGSNQLTAAVEYKTHLFHPSTIKRMLKSFRDLLSEMAFDARRRLSGPPWLAPPSELRENGFEVKKTFSPPRSQLELQLVKTWEKVLGICPIGIHDNFFDLGGHSLLALRLSRKIEKVLGINLPLSTLFQAPTVEEFARIVSNGQISNLWSSLVPIQTGGSRQPFFCIHASGGHIMIYYSLAKYSGKDQPFYGLQSRGIDGKHSFLESIEEMAAHYIEEIQTLQPQGPYFLGGYCMGGLVAYEIARQLREQGQNVAFLALFNTFNWSKMTAFTFLDKLSYRTQEIVFYFRNLILAKPMGRFKFFMEKLNQAKQWMKLLLGRSRNLSLETLLNINNQALWRYHPQPYPGKIFLFLSFKNYSLFRDPKFGWSELAAEGVETHKIHAYPGGILVEPFVRELAAKLGACMDKAHKISTSRQMT